ncbi:hypothetical protein GCM10010954_27440 [Halobacillus andaensis]|uniref:Uncharacterized protein n=1 Tax=Halobacillus andaensis TaxID=1176239 RepID=A0A917B751_HALAA|nr:hypothetical protein [Halobacillus andaensis]GGF26902.1 hypothetical protein GCM10010954_27440 [Halobacillus andaensis]
MKWKLRIPMMIFVFGLVSGVHQYIPGIIIFQDSYLLRSVQYIGTLAVIIYLLEVFKINEIKVHFSLGLLLILNGFLFDYVTTL